jgi:GntR family transcriptional repressor for pyruvate dehydrogenase complex
MTIPFRPVKRIKLYQEVASQVKEAVLDGRLKPGRKLPSERKLQAMFNTSRPTIREAVRVLENTGLIKIKRGKMGGMFISSQSFNPLKENFELLAAAPFLSFDHIAEFRERLESQVVATAFERVGDEDIKELKKLVNAAGTCLTQKKRSIPKFLENDARFHLKLSQIAGNPAVVYVLGAIYSLTGYYERFYRLDNRVLDHSLQDLCDILSAFSSHQQEQARVLVKNHIRRFNAIDA